jgi:hypothetical protein
MRSVFDSVDLEIIDRVYEAAFRRPSQIVTQARMGAVRTPCVRRSSALHA